MPENTILLVPALCLIATLIMLRRGMRPTQRHEVRFDLTCDTDPARAAIQALNADLERTKALLADVESSAAAIERAQRVVREQRKSKLPEPAKVPAMPKVQKPRRGR